jgi:alkylation response protein AidB-like acyl-CoA dehydrogenase
MDLELTDEQRWLSESVDTLLARESLPIERMADATAAQRRRVWEELVAFGALSLGGEDGIGAVEACLIARSLGAHLAAAPYVASAALRLALIDAPSAGSVDGETAFALALLEPGSSWSSGELLTKLRTQSAGAVVTGEKVAIEQADLAEQLAIVAALDGEPALALTSTAARGVVLSPRSSFDPTLPMSAAFLEEVAVEDTAVFTGATALRALERLTVAGSLLAAAEALGAADRIFGEACRYAGERRQFGRSIASFQSLRHILADLYVRSASGWSAVLYAAAAFDEGAHDAAQTASIAKAYVSRGAREVAHGAMQVFGGIAFTAEHPAHRFLRRIVVREQQFGDAAHHERALGRHLASRATRPLVPVAAVPSA